MKKLFILTVFLALIFQITNAQSTRRSDRKIIEIKKIITISPTQEETIRQAYEAYSVCNDSILYQVQDALQAAYLKRKSEKTYNQLFMAVLTESQKNTYIQITSTPEVAEKAAAKVAVLKETGGYTDAQLDSAQTEIFNYLMLEKKVYAKEKYNYHKQKENIGQLKKLQPSRLKQANARQKLHAEGLMEKGKIHW